MSTLSTEDCQEQSAHNVAKMSGATRVDAPHIANLREIGKVAVGGAAATQSVPSKAVARQLRTQATQLASHLRLQQKELDHRQSQVNAQAARLERDARAARLWLRERECEVQQQARTQQQQLDAERRRRLAELEKQRQAVERRSEQVDQCQATLEKLRAELSRMHRETLEIRLATEELWGELSGTVPPAALTQSLGRIRSKLADQYRQANAELQSQKDELERIRGQLAEQYKKLEMQKDQFDRPAAARREEAEQHAWSIKERSGA